MQDLNSTIYAQYANSPTINTLLEGYNQAVDPSGDIDLFYENIWDVASAQGVGLDIWGRIVGVTRVLNVASGVYLGFSNADDVSLEGWSQSGIWYSGSPATSNYTLTDSAFLTLIYAKALANIWDGSIPGLNNILMTLFGETGLCWVVDNQNMTMVYHFAFQLTPVQTAIMNSGIVPVPAGVTATIVQA